jgi:hypothetical protein
MKKLIILTLFLWIGFSTSAQNTSLIEPSSVTYNDLSNIQKMNYDNFVDPEEYTAYNIVQLNDLNFVQTDGIINLNLPFLPSSHFVFKAAYTKYINPNEYFFYGQSVLDNDFINSKISYQKYGGEVMMNLVVNKENWDVYDIGNGLGLMCKTLEIEENVVCGSDLIPKIPIAASEVINPCIGAISKILVLFDQQVASKYSVNTINTKVNLSVNQTNAIRMNSGNASTLLLTGVQQISFTLSSPTSSATIVQEAFNDVDKLATQTPVAQALRDQQLADIVVLLIRKPYKKGGTTVYGITNGLGGTADDAYALVSWTAATNKRRIFAHEVHHIYDARHQNDVGTIVPYSHAHNIVTTNFDECNKSNCYTIMWDCANGETIDYLSTPNRQFASTSLGVVPVGVAGFSENARRVEERDLAVSLFRQDPPLPLFVSLSIGNYDQCSLLATATAKVKCGTPPYSYSYFSSNDGISWSAIGTAVSNATTDYFDAWLNIPYNNGTTGIYTSKLFKVTVTDANANSFTDIRSAHSWCKGDGSNWITDYTSGGGANRNANKAVAKSLIEVYPNPNNTGKVNILLSSADKDLLKSIALHDMNNKLIRKYDFTFNVTDNIIQIELPKQLTKGNYYFIINTINNIYHEKLIIQ